MTLVSVPAVPPQHILVTSSWDEGRVVSGIIGPYPEGADVTLSCQVSGGMNTNIFYSNEERRK